MDCAELKERVLEQLEAAQEALKVDGGAYFAGRVNAYLAVMKLLEDVREDSLPKWFQVEKDGCFDKPHNFLLDTKEGMFFCSGNDVPRDGYALFVDDLLGLPKVDIKP